MRSGAVKVLHVILQSRVVKPWTEEWAPEGCVFAEIVAAGVTEWFLLLDVIEKSVKAEFY